MPASFSLAPNLAYETLSLTYKYLSTPRGFAIHRDTSGVVWVSSCDYENTRLQFAPLSSADGIITTSLISSSTITNKTVGTSPIFNALIRDTSGVVWSANSNASGSNGLSFFPISATNGIVSTSVISSATVTNRNPGSGPQSNTLYQDQSGVIWSVSTHTGTNNVSFLPISSTDGIVTTSLISSSTITNKAVGSSPRRNIVYRDTSGVIWSINANRNNNNISFFPISSTDGIVSTSVISSATVTNKNVVSEPGSIAIYRDVSGVVWLAAANNSGFSISLFPISGSDGIVTTSVISSATVTNKNVGVGSPLMNTIYRDDNGFVWSVNTGGTLGGVVFFPISTADGIISAASINSSSLTPLTGIGESNSVEIYKDTSNVTWAVITNSNSNNAIFSPINNSRSLRYNFTESPADYFVKANNTAEISTSLEAIDLPLGLQGASDNSFAVFGRLFSFSYSGTLANPAGILASGNTIRLTTSSADISNIMITLASGSTFRLGKKAGPYTVSLVSQSGSTIEVYPDSDRSGSPLDLRNQSIASGTTINVTTGTATVRVSSTTGLIAGAGVTLITPKPTLTLTGYPSGSTIIVSRSGIQQDLVNDPTPPYIFTADNGATLYDVRITNPAYKTYTGQFDLTDDISTPIAMLPATTTQTIIQPLLKFIELISDDTAYLRVLSEAALVPALTDELAMIKSGMWADSVFKTSWNAALDHASVTDPSVGEVAAWAVLLTTSGYAGVISFTSTGRIN